MSLPVSAAAMSLMARRSVAYYKAHGTKSTRIRVSPAFFEFYTESVERFRQGAVADSLKRGHTPDMEFYPKSKLRVSAWMKNWLWKPFQFTEYEGVPVEVDATVEDVEFV